MKKTLFALLLVVILGLVLMRYRVEFIIAWQCPGLLSERAGFRIYMDDDEVKDSRPGKPANVFQIAI